MNSQHESISNRKATTEKTTKLIKLVSINIDEINAQVGKEIIKSKIV